MDHACAMGDPIAVVRKWLEEARAAASEPHAMTLATATRDGAPSARVVLLRGLDERGFVFFTNHASRKGEELAGNPRAALVLHWHELGRQVRVEGRVEEVSVETATAYWRGRPRGSQIAAWASRQSHPLRDREELDKQVAEMTERFDGENVPLPPFWGGYRVVPDAIELWEHRDDRLHDRTLFTRAENGWRSELLAP